MKTVLTGILTIIGLVFMSFVWQVSRGPLLSLILKSGDYLLDLVNKENSLGFYVPRDLVSLKALGANGKYIRQVAYDDLASLMGSAAKAGLKLRIISAYRSYSYQKYLFDRYIKRDPLAGRYSAEAGHSEHQLGTTIDFGIGNSAIDLTSAFAKTKESRWLADHAWQYGFMLSYPEGKEKETGYMYEPWHYRYIGVQAAKEAHNAGLDFQEYLSNNFQE